MQNEKLKKFTDFFVKYRRYFCAAVLFVILVVILVKCTGPQKDQKETQNGTQGVTQTTEYQEIGKLQKDADPELVTLMENYYAAYAGGDTDSLEMIAQPLSDNEKSYITTFSEYYEDYQNITCYSTKGATDDSYLVSVCYDLKFKGVDTPAPGMDFFYVERDGKGNLIIINIYSAYNFNFLDQDLDANLYSLILAYEKSDEVVALSLWSGFPASGFPSLSSGFRYCLQSFLSILPWHFEVFHPPYWQVFHHSLQLHYSLSAPLSAEQPLHHSSHMPESGNTDLHPDPDPGN